MKRHHFRIVKLGGSLLTQPDWVSALTAWLEARSTLQNILVVGGGLAADAVRSFDQSHKIDPQRSHDLAIEAMGLSLQMALTVLPQADVITALPITNLPPEKLLILDARPFLRTSEPLAPGIRLPHDWTATSDSIAARIAAVYGAEELALLKSSLPQESMTWEQAARSGFVDEHFPRAVEKVKIAYCVNLADPALTSWEPQHCQSIHQARSII